MAATMAEFVDSGAEVGLPSDTVNGSPADDAAHALGKALAL
jgi:hypothetical protein